MIWLMHAVHELLSTALPAGAGADIRSERFAA